MANVKRVRISGELPFNTYDYPVLHSHLGSMNAPCFGLRIRYEGESRRVPNSHGGQTTMFRYVIEGEEAVGWGWIDALKQAIRDAGGTIEGDEVRDLEA